MEKYKIVTIEELVLAIIESTSIFEINIATDFDEEQKLGDIVSEDLLECWYELRKIRMADTTLIACVYSGGQLGGSFLFDINTERMGEKDIQEMKKDLALNLGRYLDMYDGMVAVQITE